MHPPRALCEEIYRIHPQLRVCWAGRERAYEGELNPGSFGLVQLYHYIDSGTPDLPRTYREFWDVEMVKKESGGFENQAAHRGPIFNRWGGTDRDWDILTRHPIWVMNFEDFGFSTQNVIDRSFIPYLRRSWTSQQQRMRNSAKQKAKDFEREIDDIGEAAGDHLWFNAIKPESTGPMIAKKFNKYKPQEVDFEHIFTPKNIPAEGKRYDGR